MFHGRVRLSGFDTNYVLLCDHRGGLLTLSVQSSVVPLWRRNVYLLVVKL